MGLTQKRAANPEWLSWLGTSGLLPPLRQSGISVNAPRSRGARDSTNWRVLGERVNILACRAEPLSIPASQWAIDACLMEIDTLYLPPVAGMAKLALVQFQ